MAKKPRKNDPDSEPGFKGSIPWSLEEFNWVTAQFIKRKQKNDHRPPHIILGEIFLRRYSDRSEFIAHFYRHRQIINFVDKHREQLIKDGFSGDDGEGMGFMQALIVSLCTLPFTQEEQESGHKFSTFSYQQVKDATRAKLNAPLN